jgi:hypothetical protein
VRVKFGMIAKTFGVVSIFLIAFLLLRDTTHPYVLGAVFSGLYGLYAYRFLLTPEDKVEIVDTLSPYWAHRYTAPQRAMSSRI